MDEVLTRLANGDLLAYKIPLPPATVPKKTLELVDAVGPRYEAVPLGPEGKAETISAGSDEAPASGQPKSLDESEKRLVAARERLEKNGYQAKYSDEEQLEKVQRNSVSKERFLVSFQTKNDSPGTKLAFQRDSGLVPIWATSFDQLENADSDPQLIADILATPYDPSKDYVLYIIDRGENLEQFGCNTIIPTWENIQAPTQKYLGEKYDPKLLSEVMTPEYQMQYARDINTFKSAGLNEFNKKHQRNYAEKLDPLEQDRFLARHSVRTEIGANSEFTGNGLTQSREGSTSYGVVEVLTLENNPPVISNLTNVKLINLKPRGVI